MVGCGIPFDTRMSQASFTCDKILQYSSFEMFVPLMLHTSNGVKTAGEVYLPTEKPASFKIAARKAPVEPFPFVPAI